MKKIYTIGRDPQNDIVINDNTDVVSRLHATIRIDGSKMFLIDQSQNGTYVNGMRMSANEEIPVTREDTVSFANVAELNWTLLPDSHKTQMRTIGIVIAVLIAVAATVFSVLCFMDDKGETTSEVPNTTLTTDIDTKSGDDENTVESDTIPVETITTPAEEVIPSTPTSGKKKGGNMTKEKKEEQPKEEKKETPKPENDIPLY